MSYVTLFSRDLQEAIFSGGFANGMAGINGYASAIMNNYFEADPADKGLNRLIYVDLKTSLADDLLALTDRMTMAASIECRAPFIDHELVELASRIPASLKVRGLTMKYLLKKVVEPWLPREILHRKKRGFGAPMGSWIRRDLEPLVKHLLSGDQIKKRGLFNSSFIQQIIAKHMEQKSDYTDHLMALVNLELWCRIFLDKRDHRETKELLLAE
jgi:asparagine synthase (glutamine-hydrolysing)